MDDGWFKQSYLVQVRLILGPGEATHLFVHLAVNVHRLNQPLPHSLSDIAYMAACNTFYSVYYAPIMK